MTQSELEASLLGQIRMLRLPEPQTEYTFHPTRKWRFDLAWPAQKLAAEVDGAIWGKKCETCGKRLAGGRHATGSGIEADAEKYSEAAAYGWLVFRLTKSMIESGEAVTYLERALHDSR